MKKFIIAMMSVLFLIVGCQVEVIENSPEDNSVAEFIAISESFDGNTKTTLGNDNNILWSQGDQLAIFQGCNIADKYQVTDATAGTGQGVFSIVSDESGSINGDFSAGMEIATNIAFYPYMESLSCSKNNVNNSTSEVTSYNIDNIILPEVQYYAENSFCIGSFPMVAVTEGLKDHTLKFKNVLGAIKLQLKGSQTVKSIMITGKNNEKLSGAATVSAYSNSLNPAITMTGDEESAKSVTLDCGVGVQLDESVETDFIISLPPVLFSHGFTVIVADNEEQTYTITASTSNTILRSSILVMPVVDLNTMDEDESDDNKYKDYIDEYGVNHGKGIIIGDAVWAPVNCGYKAANGEDKGYPYGKLYQWGRKYGQGYDKNDETYPSIAYIVQGPVDLSWGNSEECKNKFFLGGSYDSPYAWHNQQERDLWNSGTEANPLKTQYDPCPSGWRVPTHEELCELHQNYSAWITNEAGQNGYWFSGTNTYSEDVPQIFLPAAGWRGATGRALDRGSEGRYWSSRSYYNYKHASGHRFYRDYVSWALNTSRTLGYSVRCVQE